MKLTKHILEAIQRGINLAIDDFNDVDIEVQKTGQIKHSLSTQELIKYSYFIDLGLPSGTLWAKYNVGVNPNMLNKASYWYGGYYAWGEIEDKQNYNWETYKYANGDYYKFTKYCNDVFYCDSDNGVKPDNLTVLQDIDDVAAQTDKLPLSVKMPTVEQLGELMEYTTNKNVENYQGISGLNGRIFTSKANNNEIFIPAAGYRAGSSYSYSGRGSNCFLWSSSLSSSGQKYAVALGFYSSACYLDTYARHFGFSVRSVLIK